MKRILYVEDSLTSQMLMRRYLAGRCTLTIAQNLPDAEQLLTEPSFDLVVTDFVFPDTDAFEFIQRLRNRYTWQSLPVLVVSSSMDPALLNRVLKAGANEGASKPIQVEEFRKTVDRLLTEPYVRTLERPATSVSCFQWVHQGVHYQFCPELNLTLSGADAAEVGRSMAQTLAEKVRDGASLGCLSRERIVNHTVQP